jgi:hypothetical protein
MLINSQINKYIGSFFNNKKVFNSFGKNKEENENFLLISSDIGNNFAESEHLFRNIKITTELPFQSFPEEYWEFSDAFFNEEVSVTASWQYCHGIVAVGSSGSCAMGAHRMRHA